MAEESELHVMKQAPFRWEMLVTVLAALVGMFAVVIPPVWSLASRVNYLEWNNNEKTQKDIATMMVEMKSLRAEITDDRYKAMQERNQMLLELRQVVDALGVRMEKRVP